MYREFDVRVPLEAIESDEKLQSLIARTAKVKGAFDWQLIRRSIDARGSGVKFQLRVGIKAPHEAWPEMMPYRGVYSSGPFHGEVHIIGAGPAGYFAALTCLEFGLRPIVLDRGKDVRSRRRDLRAIQQDGLVNPDSNYCFGEGGAGTYSDGKLYTRSHKRGSISKVLHLLVEHGAKEDILIDAHPHIGSNKLPGIIAQMRQTIESHGGEIRFETRVLDFELENGRIRGLHLADGSSLSVERVILATGHSARDIYELFAARGWRLEAKDFALGVRIEHPQPLIDRQQYGMADRPASLPAASYRLATQVEGCGVFSFCMCPGGLIVPASTAPGELVVNGMSLSRRDSPYANSGFVTGVDAKDWAAHEQEGVLAPLRYQAAAERRFFEAGDGSQAAPAQRISDFLAGRLSPKLNASSYIPGLYSAPIHELLPEPVAKRLAAGLRQMSRSIRDYVSDEGQLIGIESRTSSPLRIPRDDLDLQHPDLQGLYPCGEGAGFAGGILSAAMDGQRVAEAIAMQLGLERLPDEAPVLHTSSSIELED